MSFLLLIEESWTYHVVRHVVFDEFCLQFETFLLLIYTAFVLLCFFYVYVPDRGVDHPPLSVAEVKNEICTPTPPLWLHGVLRGDIVISILVSKGDILNPLNAELNPICYFLALLAQNFLHVSRIRVKSLPLGF